MNVPSEQERCISTQRHRANEGVPCWVEKELNQRDDLEQQSQNESSSSSDLR
jgi:hypothetical protein